MKKIILIGLTMLSYRALYSQTIARSTLIPAAIYAESSGYGLSSIIGEMSAVATFEQGNYILTQGFLQPLNLTLTTKNENEPEPNDIVIYPNPSYQKAYLQLSARQSGIGHLRVVNVSGQEVYHHPEFQLDAGEICIPLPSEEMASATYVIQVELIQDHHVWKHSLPWIISRP